MTDQELNDVIRRTEAANAHWVNGEWEQGYGSFLTDRDDGSIYGPFGGPAVSGKAWAERGPQTVKQFKNGKSKLNVVNAYASGDLCVLVTLEEQTTDIAGKHSHPWSLR